MTSPLDFTPLDERSERAGADASRTGARLRGARPTAILFLRPKLSIAVDRDALTVDVRPGVSSAT